MRLVKIYICFVIAVGLVVSLKANQVKQFVLNPEIVYTIKTCYDRGVTTIMFPSGINGGLYGANVTRKPNDENADFLIDYSNGNYYFSIRALRKHAVGSLNIVYNRKIYILKLQEASPRNEEEPTEANVPYGSVTFIAQNGFGRSTSNRPVSPERLLSLIDQAKGYKLFQKVYPESMKNVIYYKPPAAVTYKYRQFDVKLKEVFRFDKEDTLIFKIMLRNKTDKEITYDPQLLAVRLGQIIYYASITDASGVMPPQAEVPAYFGITGTPTGGRNRLQPNNDWTVLLTTHAMVQKKATLSREAQIYEKIEKLYELDDPEKILKQTEKLQKELKKLKE